MSQRREKLEFNDEVDLDPIDQIGDAIAFGGEIFDHNDMNEMVHSADGFPTKIKKGSQSKKKQMPDSKKAFAIQFNVAKQHETELRQLANDLYQNGTIPKNTLTDLSIYGLNLVVQFSQNQYLFLPFNDKSNEKLLTMSRAMYALGDIKIPDEYIEDGIPDELALKIYGVKGALDISYVYMQQRAKKFKQNKGKVL